MADEEPKVKTFEDWKKEYIESKVGSTEEAEALAKMAETATTLKQWEYVFDWADLDSEIEAKAKAEMDKFEK